MGDKKSNPTIQCKMGLNPKQQDPIRRVEKDGTSYDPNIKHNGGIYNPESFCIVHTHETEKEKQMRENQQNGYGAVTNSEVAIMMECRFDSDPEPWYEEEEYEIGNCSYYIPDNTGASFDSLSENPEAGEILEAAYNQYLDLENNGEQVDTQGELSKAFSNATSPEEEPQPESPSIAVNTPSPSYQAPTPAPTFA